MRPDCAHAKELMSKTTANVINSIKERFTTGLVPPAQTRIKGVTQTVADKVESQCKQR